MDWGLLFFPAWLGLAALAYFLFIRSKNAAFKKRYYKPFVVLVGIAFAAFSVSVSPGAPRYMIIGSVALITLLNLRAYTFCEACGSTVGSGWIARAKECPACGAEMKG